MNIRLFGLPSLLVTLLTVSGCVSADKGTVYTIEAGFFANHQEALARAALVEKVLGNARVDTDLIHRQAVYRVFSGAYPAPQDAGRDIAKLKKSGVESKAVPKL
jgi:hypothetical protein